MELDPRWIFLLVLKCLARQLWWTNLTNLRLSWSTSQDSKHKLLIISITHYLQPHKFILIENSNFTLYSWHKCFIILFLLWDVPVSIKNIIGPSGVRALPLGVAAERSVHNIWYYFSSFFFLAAMSSSRSDEVTQSISPFCIFFVLRTCPMTPTL